MNVIKSIFGFLRLNKKNWKAVVLSVLIAAVFWFFNALNKIHTATISFPIEYEYDQTQFIPASDLPDKIKLNVTGVGWNLLRRSIGLKSPTFRLVLESPTPYQKISTTTLLPTLADQASDITINFSVTDTLSLDIEPLTERWISLTIDSIEKNIQSGYIQASDVVVYPDSIPIKGPLRIINKIQEPYRLSLFENNIDRKHETQIIVDFENERIQTDSLQKVNAFFEVEKAAIIHDSIKWEIQNSRNIFRSAPDYVRYTLITPQSRVKDYNRDSIFVRITTDRIPKKTKVMPKLTGLPPFTKIIQIDSIQIQ